jgi:hypothetical protein
MQTINEIQQERINLKQYRSVLLIANVLLIIMLFASFIFILQGLVIQQLNGMQSIYAVYLFFFLAQLLFTSQCYVLSKRNLAFEYLDKPFKTRLTLFFFIAAMVTIIEIPFLYRSLKNLSELFISFQPSTFQTVLFIAEWIAQFLIMAFSLYLIYMTPRLFRITKLKFESLGEESE